jgi:glucan 1,3-beta-glucosidase
VTTLRAPLGSHIVGEAWSTISTAGEFFNNADDPKPVAQIGAPGGMGIIHVKDPIGLDVLDAEFKGEG